MVKVPNQLVDAAIAALAAFGDLDRVTAACLLPMWVHRRELTAADHLAVLDHFGPAPVQPAHDGYPVGGRR